MKYLRTLGIATAIMLLGRNSPASVATHQWKLFVSRGVWSISYPAVWKLGSCRSCSDKRAPNVYVDFFPPRHATARGWVIVEPLADKPQDMSPEVWLTKVSKENNVNKQIGHDETVLNGLTALKVRYQYDQNGGSEMEDVYVLGGSKTVSIGYTEDTPGPQLDKSPNYPVFLRMLETFHMNS